ncbi:MAG: hypothetical protein KGH59_01835 [Candidatus Micrarchaeota archaeon]|nr:hypothetical protein [Candidatus Micrarchaeota archaeon]MDE1804504.1 hypothetical protein [Candidatus Micrarchaeota archaeon]
MMGLQRTKRYVDSYKPDEDRSSAYSSARKKLTMTFSESIADRKHSITFVAYPPQHGGQVNLQEGLQNAIDLLSICELSASPVEISLYYYGNRFYPNSWSKKDVKLNYNENMRNNIQLALDDIPAKNLYVISVPNLPYNYIEGAEVIRQRLIAGAVKRPVESDGSYKEDIYCINLKMLKRIENPEKYIAILRRGQ